MQLIKVIFFEILIISLQPTPLIQTVSLLVLAILSLILTLIASFRSIFEHQIIMLKNVGLDLGFTLFFLYSMFIGLCKDRVDSVCFSHMNKTATFTVVLILIIASLLLSLVYLGYCIYLGYQKIKTNKLENVFTISKCKEAVF